MIARIRNCLDHDKPVLPGMMMAVLLLSLPNLLSCFWPRVDADLAENFWLGAGIILLPCVFSMSVRTALGLWIPFAALMPGVMVYTLVSQSPLREWAFVVLMETDSKEMERFATGVIAAVVLGPVAAWGYWRFIKRHVIPGHRLSWLSRIPPLVLSCIIPLGAFIKSGWEYGGLSSQRQLSATFPLGPLVSAISAWKIRHDLDRRGSIAQAIQVKSPEAVSDAREIYVLVIGESARYASFGINGYERETTPLLSAREGVLSFNDVIAPATVTLMSVPLLLTPARAPWLGKASSMPSLISVFKRAGYYTAWYSTQRKHGRFDTSCSIYSNDADEALFLSGNFAPGAGTYASAYDGDLIQPVRDLIAKGGRRLLIVLHTMGSHQQYGERYPAEFNHFPSYPARCEANGWSGKYDAEQIRNLTNAYDNSIRYTDWVLSQLMETLEAANAVSALYYISDHGQNKGDSPVLPFAHGSMTRDVVQVPMILWLSPEYVRQKQDKFSALASHAVVPFSGDVTFHTLIDMAGLETPLLDRTRSAASEAFHTAPRMMRDLEGRLVNYDELMKKKR